ncbi:MAG: dTMP kinase [Coriobacteriia bacterium]|nr:dTMP kinase [Coriobacteriia bacterium]
MSKHEHTFVDPVPAPSLSQQIESAKTPNAPGVFITFEGGEGAGKSTHIGFLARVLEERGYEVVRLREPGGTEIGETLRSVVLDVKNDQMTDECELLVYEAARAQIVHEVIRPALQRGAVVLCDRFYDSTIAYQAYGRGLDREFVRQCNHFACKGVHPDRTILMCTGGSTEEGLERATHRVGADRLELAGEDFHARVNEGFLKIQEQDPQRVRLVVSDQAKSVTSRRVFDQLADLFPWMASEEECPQRLFASLDVKKVQ